MGKQGFQMIVQFSPVAQHRMTGGKGRKGFSERGIKRRATLLQKPAGWRDYTVDFGKFMSLFILGRSFCDAVAQHMDAERYYQWGVKKIPEWPCVRVGRDVVEVVKILARGSRQAVNNIQVVVRQLSSRQQVRSRSDS